MNTYEVSVIKTQCANIEVQADSAEDAERRVREMFLRDGLRGWTWIDYEWHETDLNNFEITCTEKLK